MYNFKKVISVMKKARPTRWGSMKNYFYYPTSWDFVYFKKHNPGCRVTLQTYATSLRLSGKYHHYEINTPNYCTAHLRPRNSSTQFAMNYNKFMVVDTDDNRTTELVNLKTLTQEEWFSLSLLYDLPTIEELKELRRQCKKLKHGNIYIDF